MQFAEQQRLPGTELLVLARHSIEHGLAYEEPLPVDCKALPPALSEPGATFTTLRIADELRGCCGILEAVRPLAQDVVHSAFQAAFRDYRFNPLGRHELNVVSLEVSVLSPLEPLPVTSEADLLQKLRPGEDGLVIVAEGRRATFLPKVWEMVSDPAQFLLQLKRKCGLPDDYWSERLEFLRYTTITHAEPVNRDISP